MRILYLDIDTLRPDHLGCYGYHRKTSPNIDRLASEGVRFDKCYVSDAPCLPSRASMFTGRFGIHTGAVGHGGTTGDTRLIGYERPFNTMRLTPGFIWHLRQRNIYPVTFSPFLERHSAMWFAEGWMEQHNTTVKGTWLAHHAARPAIDWIQKNAKRDDWMLHVNMWDPHTYYNTPNEFGDPFADQPLDGWYTEELRQKQWNGFGPGTPQEPCGAFGASFVGDYRRMTSQITSMADYKTWIDGYDTGIAYADHWCGHILNALADQGVLDDTIVMVTSDHGENFGELNVIGDHMTADHICSRVPMIVRYPGLPGGRVDDALHYQTDIAATMIQLAGGNVHKSWDGQGFAGAFKEGRSEGRPYVVFSQNAWSCQRSVRWDDNVFIRTYHTGLKDYPARMLFDVGRDPHEVNNLAESQPALADHGAALIEEWVDEMMRTSPSQTDPMWTVMAEGGPYHAREKLKPYCERLRATGRAHHAEFLEAHPSGF